MSLIVGWCMKMICWRPPCGRICTCTLRGRGTQKWEEEREPAFWFHQLNCDECLFSALPALNCSCKCSCLCLFFLVQLPPGVQVSDDCRDLLLRMLQRNPDDRISFEEFFTHPFVDLLHSPSPECINNAVCQFVALPSLLSFILS